MEEARRHGELGLTVARRFRADVPYMLSTLAEIEERAGNYRKAREHLAAIAPVPELLTGMCAPSLGDSHRAGDR